MRLPNAHLAIVPLDKITRYLLNASHPAGKSKAAFFVALGFNPGQPDHLANALLEHGRENEVHKQEEIPFGIKYTVEGGLNAPCGRSRCLASVWFIAKGDQVPRLVTAFPCRWKGGSK